MTYDDAINEHIRDFIKPLHINNVEFDGKDSVKDDFLNQKEFKNMIFGYRYLFIDKCDFYEVVRAQTTQVLNRIKKYQRDRRYYLSRANRPS